MSEVLIKGMEMPKACWECQLVEVDLIAQEELITPLNMIGGYLKKVEGSDT